MWRNGQVAEFLDRLKDINATIADPDRKAGFYGLDIYSLGASIEAVLAYLDKVDPEAARSRASAMAASRPGAPSPPRYGRMALSRGYALCEKPVTDALLDLLQQAARLSRQGRRGVLRRRAERAHRRRRRAILPGHVLRRRGVVESARPAYVRHARARCSPIAGRSSKAVVWAHNSHIGNAAFTEMGQVRGEHNIGQLARAALRRRRAR